MSQSQPPKPLDPVRLNAYATQFKAPFQNILAALNQVGPNCIDELINQCVTLETQVKELVEENEKLTKEKDQLTKNIVKDKEVKPVSK